VGSRAGLGGCGKSRPHRDSIPGPSSRERVAIPSALSQLTNNNCSNIKLYEIVKTGCTLAGDCKIVFLRRK